MTKTLIEQVAENIQLIAPCPACEPTPGLADNSRNQMGPGSNGLHKRGRWKGAFRSAMPVCNFCRGLGVVYLNRICECGMPAVLFDAKRKVWFCGTELCATHASWRNGLHGSSSSVGPWSGL